MRRFFDRLDLLAGIDDSGAAAWLKRAAFVLLVLMVAASPHSIAATQTAWIAGMFLWLLSAAPPSWRRLRRRLAGESSHEENVSAAEVPLRSRSPRDSRQRAGIAWLNIFLWSFFAWSAITCFTSYAPEISVDKLRGAAVFLIFYFVFFNLRTLRAVRLAAVVLLVSCMVNVLWTPLERLVGRGVEIHGVAAGGPLAKALLTDGDTLLAANGRKLRAPDDVLAAVEQAGTAKVKFYRPDFEYTVEVKSENLLPGATALERLGIASWTKSHNWRSSGFYGHYTTYAEMLQLVAALAFGLLIASLLYRKARSSRLGVSGLSMILFGAVGFICLALLLTVTRASQLGFLAAAFVVVAVAGSRKLFFAAIAVALPMIVGALIFLQQSRNVGFLDAKDDSTIYRETMWRDGLRLWTDSPRNFVFGVGMDSVQRYWRDWGMFDGGRLPMGHFHSTPIQLLAERGLPALLLWVGVLAVYAWVLWTALRRQGNRGGAWVERGIMLGCLGGIAGFFTSGLVHYNLGDQEVAMMFFLLMGLGIRTAVLRGKAAAGRSASYDDPITRYDT